MTVGRTWKLWAHRYADGALWNVGDRDWVELHGLPDPIVPVLVEEFLGDRYADEVTHYGWEDAPSKRSVFDERKDDVPAMIQVRTGNDPQDPNRALMFLQMCFPYGIGAAVERGDGQVIAMRITERSESA
jgi:hypothetical protein